MLDVNVYEIGLWATDTPSRLNPPCDRVSELLSILL